MTEDNKMKVSQLLFLFSNYRKTKISIFKKEQINFKKSLFSKSKSINSTSKIK